MPRQIEVDFVGTHVSRQKILGGLKHLNSLFVVYQTKFVTQLKQLISFTNKQELRKRTREYCQVTKNKKANLNKRHKTKVNVVQYHEYLHLRSGTVELKLY